MSETNKVAEIKKLNNGKLAVRWEGTEEFVIVEDDMIAEAVIFLMTRRDDETHTVDRARQISRGY